MSFIEHLYKYYRWSPWDIFIFSFDDYWGNLIERNYLSNKYFITLPKCSLFYILWIQKSIIYYNNNFQL